jgi:hypothetical protein
MTANGKHMQRRQSHRYHDKGPNPSRFGLYTTDYNRNEGIEQRGRESRSENTDFATETSIFAACLVSSSMDSAPTARRWPRRRYKRVPMRTTMRILLFGSVLLGMGLPNVQAEDLPPVGKDKIVANELPTLRLLPRFVFDTIEDSPECLGYYCSCAPFRHC